MKTLITALALATLIAVPAFVQSAGAAPEARRGSDQSPARRNSDQSRDGTCPSLITAALGRV
jgi:hypothetical protein